MGGWHYTSSPARAQRCLLFFVPLALVGCVYYAFGGPYYGSDHCGTRYARRPYTLLSRLLTQ